MPRLLVLLILLLALATVSCSNDDLPKATTFDRATVTVSEGGLSAKVNVEIASTEKQREQGLMLRQSMPEDAGMLFLFPTDTTVGFWMRNTYLPLDIAYLDPAGKVLEVRRAQPLDETPLIPLGPYRYTLELNQGWFERHGYGPSAVITLPRSMPTPE